MGFSGHHARKRFGQHWLRDDSVLQRIVEAADLQPTDRVLEVGRSRRLNRASAGCGGGGGACDRGDRDLVAGLQDRFAAHPEFSLHQGDVLERHSN